MRSLPQVALAKDDGSVVCEHCLLAETMFARLRGLLGRSGRAEGEGMLLRPASSIHTAFMRFAIDAVFLDRDATIDKVADKIERLRRARPIRLIQAASQLPMKPPMMPMMMIAATTSTATMIRMIHHMGPPLSRRASMPLPRRDQTSCWRTGRQRAE